MKSKHLLLTLLLALIVPWAARAQETKTVHQGTNTSRGVPMYAYYFDEYTKSQHVIPADDLANMSGGTITSIKYYYTTSSSTPYSTATQSHVSINLYITEVESASISSLMDFSSYTPAYTGYITYETDGTVAITLDHSYIYGGGNLMIGVENPEKGGSNNYDNVYFYGETGTQGASTYSNNSNSASSITYKSSNTSNFLPYTTFTYTPAPTPTSAPGVTTSETIADLTNVSVKLGGTITDMGGANSVQAGICYSTTSEPTTSDGHVQSGCMSTGAYTRNITGLLPGTTYYFRAYAYSGYNSLENPTYGDIYSFTTAGNITITQPANGEISASVAGGTPTTSNTYALEGQSVTLTATTADGYSLDCWNVTGVTGEANGNTYTFTMPTNNVTATASIVPTPGGSSTATAWAETTTISTEEPYLIGAVSGNDVYLVLNYNPTTSSYYYDYNWNYWSYTAKATLDGNGNVTGCTGNATDLLYAQWTFSAETGGTITSNYESGRYLYGTTGSYTDLYPSTSTTTWTYSNNQLSYGSTNYLYLNSSHYVQKGTSSTASTVKLYTETEIVTYAIVATANLLEGGSVTGSDYYANGASCTLTATPAFGYDFVSWTEGGEVVSLDATYTFTVSAARTLVANFESQGSCIKPTNLAQVPNTLAAHQAQLGWTENNGATEWEVVYSTDSEFDPDEATPIAVNSNPATIPGLEQETTYYASVRAICGQGSQSGWSTKSAFETMSGHQAPTATYDLNTLTAHTVTVTWTGVATNVLHQSYDVYYSTIDETPTTQTPQYTGITATSKEIVGLDGGTTYYVWVRDNCGNDGYSDWSNKVPFTTEIACPAPTAFNVVPNSITAHTAGLTWEGTSDSYVVSYRTAAYTDGTTEEFNSTSIPTGWLLKSGLLDDVLANTATLSNATYGWSFGTANNVFNSHARTEIYGTSRKHWLIAPSQTLGNNMHLDFDLALTYWTGTNVPEPATNGTDDKFVVLISTDNMTTWTILRQWDNDANTIGDIYAVYNDITCSATGEHISIDLNAYAGETVYIAFYGESTVSNADNNLHIDNVAIGTPVAAGEWMTVNPAPTMAPVTLDDLLADTKYEATLQGDCGDEGPSTVVGPITFTTAIACPAPTTLTKSNLKSTQVDLSWVNGGAENWVVAYRKVMPTAIEFTEVSVATANVTIEGTTVTYTLTGLDEETLYEVKVQDNCEASIPGDGVSEWTDPINFTTLAACALDNVTVSDITHYNATVSWDGESASGFTVSYRTAAGVDGINEEFGTSIPTEWQNMTGLLSNVMAGTATLSSGSQWNFGTNNNTFDNHARINIYGSSRYGWLITPEMTLPSGATFSFDLALNDYDYTTPTIHDGTCDDDRFIVLVYSDNAWHILREWNNTGSADIYNDIAISGETVTVDVSGYVGKTVKFAFYGESTVSGNGDNNLHIDNVMIGTQVPAGQTQTVVVTENTANLDELTAGQKYEVWVKPNCDETLASDTIQFTTVSPNQKWFITEGNWNVNTNWEPTGVPTIDQDVVLKANATIASGEAFAKSIAGTGTGTDAKTLTIEDGAKLKHLNSNVRATVKKHINAWTIQESNEAGTELSNGWYLIANPTTSNFYPSEENGFLVGNYDLYNWDHAQADEWRNFEVTGTFAYLKSGAYGYLYANNTETDLTYTGTINAYTSYKYRSCSVASNPDNYDFPSWYLLGNPYLYDAYLTNTSTNTATTTALPYYRMNQDGDEIEPVEAGTPIEPMQGFFYQGVSGATDAYVVTYVPTVQTRGNLNMNLRSGNKQLDKAIVRFGEGQQLSKFSFRANSSKIYMPVEGKDYAIANAEQMGEMPVSFKAEKNGSYTLSFTAEEVSFAYLHLIDNLTGTDVDLLANPSYSFDARTTDYASRFKLVFATGNNGTEDNFAFFSNGNFVINNDGEATLQVVDVMGRIIKSESINGCANVNVNAAPGVYMLRLINGDNMKVQKVVVR